MSTEIIYIRVYDQYWEIDPGLIPILNIYDVNTSSFVVSWASMAYDIGTKKYKYSFTSFDNTHKYSCDVYFWPSALTKYASFEIWEWSAWVELANTVKKTDMILDSEEWSISLFI